MVDLIRRRQEKMPENLSGGMRKRVGLARTIVSRPACILFDEPTTGLDPIASDSINHLIRRLQKRLQVTSVVVTHDMKTAFHTADHIAFLHEGRVYFDYRVEELRASQDPGPFRISSKAVRGRIEHERQSARTSRFFVGLFLFIGFSFVAGMIVIFGSKGFQAPRQLRSRRSSFQMPMG